MSLPPTKGDAPAFGVTALAGDVNLAQTDLQETVTPPAHGECRRENHTTAKLAAGTEVGRYIVLHRIGAGGMGEVYCAFDPELERKVAIKLFFAHASSDDVITEPTVVPTSLHLSHVSKRLNGIQVQLLNEAKAAAKVSHPNVVPIFDVGVHHDQVYLAMELVEGSSLRELIRTRKVPALSQRLRWLVECADGLHAVHQANLIHGDFKPDNVALGHDGRIRIFDFGLAKATRQPGLTGTSLAGESDIFGGTPAYLAPECLDGAPASAASDLFAWGVTLYEVACFVRPFAASPEQTDGQRDHSTAWQTLPAFRKLPLWLRQVIAKTLDRDPLARPPDLRSCAAELAAGLAYKSRRGIWGLTGGLAATAALVITMAVPDETDACEASQVSDVWGPEKAAKVEQAFLATKVPIAADVYRRVDEVFATWIESWQQVHEDSCKHGPLPSSTRFAQHTARRTCLHNAQRRAVHFSDLLVHANAKTVEKSLQALQELPNPALCSQANTTANDAVALLPADKQSEVRRLSDTLLTAEIQASMGQLENAHKTVLALDHLLDRLDWTPLRVQARIFEARLAKEDWDFRHSYRCGNQAALAAIVLDDPALNSRAWDAQAIAAGYIAPTLEQSAESVRTIQAALLRRNADAMEAAREQSILAIMLNNAHQIAASEAAAAHGLALLEQVPMSREREFMRVKLLVAQGGARALGQNPHEGEVDSLLALQVLENYFGSEHPALANPLWSAAAANLALARLDRTLEFTTRGLAIIERLDGPWTPRAAPFYHYRLDALRGLGLFATASAIYPFVIPLYTKMFSATHSRTFGMIYDQAVTALQAGHDRQAFDLLKSLHALRPRMAKDALTDERLLDLQVRIALAWAPWRTVADLAPQAQALAEHGHEHLPLTWLWAQLELARARHDNTTSRAIAQSMAEQPPEKLLLRIFDVGDALMRTLLEQGEHQRATTVVRAWAQALERDTADDDPRELWLAHWQGEVARSKGEWQHAWTHHVQAIELAQRYQHEINPNKIVAIVQAYNRVEAHLSEQSGPSPEILQALMVRADQRSTRDFEVAPAWLRGVEQK